MNAIKNKVQLIGRLGQEPEIFSFDNGSKIARFLMAIDDGYKNKEGEKVERTYWHQVIVRERLTNIVEKYLGKGKEVAVSGKLTNRSWEDDEGRRYFVTEVVCSELLLLRG
ncbi:single-stranded DNA-binding protein [Sinomicrobium soli]|uniref:single-stranded DNA-binding protein n=1 Tax=Sinomicrobium sp. N-1-3-6 TaxID=2219864 RepID=UPI000DCCD293|nr:single-stranded DNA-binding protein [Sinomicrobium sp. N-1-3-6]RAV29472.1 single-stranded DNA-binding protein [Sinomicrobium sp. N-1-3-6]